MKQHPPRQIFEKLVNKNAIKRKIGGPPLAIFPETLDPPPRNFGKNIPYPLPWIFNPCASMEPILISTVETSMPTKYQTSILGTRITVEAA
jgi:hypothetical protein